ncbi:antitermination regulator [Aquabacterium olei]|uniref:Antitermination regulator n=1 Tax=Aquabacterium olei TaxID=1296669 RepID=A0A2U8FUQ0_9BURK|nr:nitrate- and nitrite sensing domain-containing protein [Aquabacterium olei]AWI54785.1 antitermination regulator [Aquabacterium olei]
MPLSVSQLVLRARQLEIEALRQLAGRVDLADVIGRLVHALQRERGAASLHLASGGQRFGAERLAAVAQAQPVEAALRELFAAQLNPEAGASARSLSLMAWVMLDLDALRALRAAIEQRAPSAHDVVAAYSRVIAGLVELVFHLADATAHPAISRLLVAYVHLVQGKESAGQERAVGAQLFGSGACDDTEQQRIVHLIDAQERSLRVFEEFADDALRAQWQQHQLTPTVAQLERLRRTLCTARPGAALDTQLSESWFDVSSARITDMGQLQDDLVRGLRQACADQIAHAEQALHDSEGLLRHLRDNPPPHTHAVDRFFNAPGQPDAAPVLSAVSDASSPSGSAAMSSLVELLQTQSARMASMEAELDSARRALHERKIIERAKGALMSRLGLTEEAAFRALQKSAMDHNRRLLDVAEATLALPDLAFAARPGTMHQK